MRRLLLILMLIAFGHLSYAISTSHAQDPDGASPIGVAGGLPKADPFTGAATISIPIDVPSGRNGMQPDLQLVYSSTSGNGPLGIGWRLEIGGVERQTRFGVDYTKDDYTFRLSGVSMDLMQAPPPAPSNEYRAKIQGNFTRVQKLTAVDGQPYWLATDKKGTKYFYGQTAASRMTDPPPAARIFKWCLDRVEDRDGNYLTVTYISDQGQGYIDEIRYTGWSTTIQPTNMIKLYWDNTGRPDKTDMYTSNFKITTAKRLKAVAVWADLAMTKLVRAYRLQYIPSPVTGNSLLSDVRQYGKDASVTGGDVTGPNFLPSTSLTWTQGSANWTSAGSIPDLSPAQGFGTGNTAVASNCCTSGSRSMHNLLQQMPNLMTLLQPATNYPVLTGDWNGDGKTDVGRVSGTGLVFYVSNGNGTWSSGGTISGNLSPGQGYSNDNANPMLLGDWDGDGRAEVGRVSGTGVTFYRSNGTGGWTLFGSGISNFSPAQGYADANTKPLIIGDWNRDGKTDVGRVNGSGVAFYVSDGVGGWTPFGSGLADFSPAQGYADADTKPLITGDWNGDGKIDVGRVNGSGVAFYVSDGVGGWVALGSGLANFSPAQGYADANTKPLITGDWNGDGKTDVGRVNGSGVAFYVSDGVGGWVALGSGLANFSPAQGFTNANTYPIFTGDWNGNSKSDVGRVTPTGISFYWADGNGGWLAGPGSIANLSPGQGFADGYTKPLLIGDWNGDGKTDVGRVSGTGVSFYSEVSPYPDLVASFANGLGGSTTISYTSSTQYINTQLNYPVQTVSSITANDGNSNVATTSYTYSGGFHHIGERDFRGFNYAKITGPVAPLGVQTITETWFHQGSRVDAVAETTTELQAATVASTKGLAFRSKVTDQTGKVYSDSTTTYLADTDGVAPWFTPPAIVTTSIYDSAGVLAKQTQTESVTYDAYGNLTLAYNRGDFTNNNALTSDDTTTAVTFGNYDTTNWLVAFPTVQTTYAGLGTGGTKLSETKYFYDGANSCTTPAGNLIPTKGHPTKVERWLNGGTNPLSGMEYNSVGGVTCTRDPKGNQTTLVYDPTSTFPLTSTNALGHVTTTSYYGVNGVAADTGLYGQVKIVTDPNGRTVTSTYDALGRNLTTTIPDGLVSTMAYNYGGTFVVGTQHIQSTTSGGGLSVNLLNKTYFDGLGRTIKKESPGAADGGASLKVLVTETQYDSRGLVKQTSLPYIQGSESATGRWRTMTYDALGRLTQSTNPDNTSSQVCYSGWITITLDPKLHKQVETKDAFGRLSTVQEYTGQATAGTCAGGTLYATTMYAYDRIGNLLSVTDAKGNVSTMTYDTLGRKLTMHDPDMGNWSYTYDANGNLLTQVDAKNQKLCFGYDALNRRTQKNYGTTTVACGTNTVVYTYDDTVTTYNRKGRLKQVTDPAQSVTLQYDNRGRITQSAMTLDGTTYTTTSAYDGLGRLTSVSYPTTPIKTVTYTYDGPQLKQVSEGATNYVTYAGWNALGQSATSTFANGVVTTSTHANTGNTTCTQQTFRLCTLKTQKGANPLYQNLRYDYEANGNVWNIYDATVAGNAGDQHFSYDDLDRLTLANGPYGASGANASFPYSYDEIGNMTLNPQVGTYSYPASGPSSVRPHAVSVAGPYPITYDNNGNVTTMTDPTGFYGYSANSDAENRLSSVTTTYGGVPTTATFVYDGDGGRVKKIDGTTTTRYISKLYECDTVSSSTSCTRFIWAGSTRIATIASNGAVHYWHGDHLGSSSVITDSTGTKVQTVTYFPYGDMASNVPGSPVNVPYKYTGKELDGSSNLYFYEFRYYHPVFGRFVSPDTIVPNPRNPQDLNRYAYAGNNPLKYTDPTGHFSINIGKFLDRVFDSPIARGVGWGVCAVCMQFVDPATRNTAISGTVGAGVTIATFGCVPCGAAAAGAVGAALAGGDVGRGALIGAISGTVAWGVGQYTSPFWGTVAGGAAGGTASAAMGGGDVVRSALIGAGTSAALFAVTHPVEAGSGLGLIDRSALASTPQAQVTYALNTDQASIASPAGIVQSQVVRSTIAISKDGVLSFNVRVSGLGEGSGFSARLQTGLVPNEGPAFVNFIDWATIPAHTITSQVAQFGVSVSGVTGPAYLRIIPYGLDGQAPPVITNFGAGKGNYIPCGQGGNLCGSNLPYTQGY